MFSIYVYILLEGITHTPRTSKAQDINSPTITGGFHK